MGLKSVFLSARPIVLSLAWPRVDGQHEGCKAPGRKACQALLSHHIRTTTSVLSTANLHRVAIHDDYFVGQADWIAAVEAHPAFLESGLSAFSLPLSLLQWNGWVVGRRFLLRARAACHGPRSWHRHT